MVWVGIPRSKIILFSKRPRWPYRPTKSPQEAPRGSHEGPKTAPEAPKMVQEAPKTALEWSGCSPIRKSAPNRGFFIPACVHVLEHARMQV